MTVLRVISNSNCIVGDQHFRCTIGRGGFASDKREGDGATPIGIWLMRRVLYRADRLDRPETNLPTQEITQADGWCDDPAHADYNKQVTLPFVARHEVLWREDHLYDIVVVLAHNDAPPIPGKGSAIFFHCAKPSYATTEGCVALARDDVLSILRDCGPESAVAIEPQS